MNSFRVLLVALALPGMLLFACKPHKHSAESLISPADSVLAGIERGPCFGACPEYKVIIYNSGYAEYFGRRNTAMIGYFQGQLVPYQLSKVNSLLVEDSMATADSAYVNKLLADYPAYFLTIRDAHGSRSILVNHEAPPENIRVFTFELEKMLPEITWKEVLRRDDR